MTANQAPQTPNQTAIVMTLGDQVTRALEMEPLDDLVTFIKHFGCKHDQDDYSTNGWQTDFWLRFTYKGKRYGIAGGLWYGGFKVYRDTDDEEPEEAS